MVYTENVQNNAFAVQKKKSKYKIFIIFRDKQKAPKNIRNYYFDYFSSFHL